jgi:menaquinone-9 beta-reductase
VTRYDAIIIGAGPAGATTALALARAGWSVALIEKTLFPRRKVCGEFMSATNAALFAGLGIDDVIQSGAGPEVRRVGLFAGSRIIIAPMPRPATQDHAAFRWTHLKADNVIDSDKVEHAFGEKPASTFSQHALGSPWGFALARERLDDLLVQKATEAGATVLMPWRAVALVREGDQQVCTVTDGAETQEISAPVMIVAHGSWERGDLPTQTARPHRPSDLLAFKARFHNAALAADLMPLIVFPGGYGGMVNSSDKTLSLTCCIRRDMLEGARRNHQGSAAEAVFSHIKAHCRGVAETLEAAALESPPLAAGPIAPGIRPRYARGLFHVGNSAGEAHPIVAEGISMAMQSGWLLARLLDSSTEAGQAYDLDIIGAAYAKRWRQCFAPRIHAASLFAHLAMRPSAAVMLGPLIARCPAILTFGAALSGKTRLEVLRNA